jgi:hypothetical protein
MNALVLIILVVVLAGIGVLLWWLITYNRKQTATKLPDVLEEVEEKVPTKIEEFTRMYKDLYSNILELIDTGTLEVRKKTNDSITELSSIVCSNNSDFLKSLYKRKVTLLTDGISSNCSNNDLNDPVVIGRREDLAAISSSLACTFSKCIKVDIDNLETFFNISDTLFLTYNMSSDDTTKQKLRAHILKLVNRLSLREK